MKTWLMVLAAMALLLPCGSAQAQSCTYSMDQPTVAGMCPPGRPAAGSCEISGDSESFILTLTSGAVCSPAASCTYECQPAGEGFICTNSVVADNEGGRVTNTMELAPLNGDTYNGICTSEYVHPQGFSCKWVYATKVEAEFPGK